MTKWIFSRDNMFLYMENKREHRLDLNYCLRLHREHHNSGNKIHEFDPLPELIRSKPIPCWFIVGPGYQV